MNIVFLLIKWGGKLKKIHCTSLAYICDSIVAAQIWYNLMLCKIFLSVKVLLYPDALCILQLHWRCSLLAGSWTYGTDWQAQPGLYRVQSLHQQWAFLNLNGTSSLQYLATEYHKHPDWFDCYFKVCSNIKPQSMGLFDLFSCAVNVPDCICNTMIAGTCMSP